MEFKIFLVYVFFGMLGCNLNNGYTLKIQLVMMLHHASFLKVKYPEQKKNVKINFGDFNCRFF